MKRKMCGLCGKRLRYDFLTKTYFCPVEKINAEKKLGCGYVYKHEGEHSNITKEDKRKILRLLSGRT